MKSMKNAKASLHGLMVTDDIMICVESREQVGGCCGEKKNDSQ